MLKQAFAGPRGWELQNMLIVSGLLATSALWREESRGVHHRTDFPDRDDEEFNVHSRIARPGASS